MSLTTHASRLVRRGGGHQTAVATTVVGVALGVLAALPPAAAQTEAVLQAFLGAYDGADASKRRVAETMMALVGDLDGATGNEGYRIRAEVEGLSAAVTAWDDAVATLARHAAALDSAGARLVLAQAYLDRHRLDDARRECETALALDPTRGDGHALLARIHLAQAEPALAVEALERATRVDPDDAVGFYTLAATYDTLGRPAAAAVARESFVAAAERRLAALWRAPVGALGGEARARLLEDRLRFGSRSTPADLVARAGGSLAAFLPAVYETAARHLTAGDYAPAVAALRDGIARDPLTRDVPEPGGDLDARVRAARRAPAAPAAGAGAYLALGDALMALGQPVGARPAFERALALDPTLETPRRRLAGQALADLNGAAAREHLLAALEHHPDSAEVHRLLGNAYRLTQEHGRALEHYDAALALDPPAASAERIETSRQAILLAAPPGEAVAAAVEASAAAHPRSGLARQHLARYYQATGRNREAVAAFRDALERHPLVGVDRLHVRLAEILLQQSQSDESIRVSRDALAVNPDNLPPRALVARLLLEGNRLDDARVEYLAVLLADPLNADAHARLAQVALQRGDVARAAEVARRAVVEQPDHLQARYTLGQALVRSGAADAGRAELAEYARLQVADADRARQQRELDALYQEALALAGSGELERAIDLLRQAVEMDATGLAHTNLGLALMQAGRVDEAIASLEQAAVLANEAEEVHLYLADAYQEAGRPDASARARAVYERLLAERQRGR